MSAKNKVDKRDIWSTLRHGATALAGVVVVDIWSAVQADGISTDVAYRAAACSIIAAGVRLLQRWQSKIG